MTTILVQKLDVLGVEVPKVLLNKELII